MLLPTNGETRPEATGEAVMQHTTERIVLINSVLDLAALPVPTSWSNA
jgi:hypothetical protein